jgi:hypothetical protein
MEKIWIILGGVQMRGVMGMEAVVVVVVMVVVVEMEVVMENKDRVNRIRLL